MRRKYSETAQQNFLLTASNTPMLISASLKVVERSVLVRSTNAKPDAAYGVDERICLLAVDLPTHAPDVNIDDVGARVKMQIPDLFQKHRSRHNMACVADQIFEELEFAWQ